VKYVEVELVLAFRKFQATPEGVEEKKGRNNGIEILEVVIDSTLFI
jgi:hypothetical protein